MGRRRSASVIAALSLAAAAVVLPAAPALAHTELKAMSPAAESTVRKPVANVVLTFTGLIKQTGTTVIVRGPDGTSYSDGAARQLDKKITQKVTPLPVGAINVAWRTVAADGHPMKGSFTFTNRAVPASSPSPSVEQTPSAAPTASTALTSGAAGAPAVVPAAGTDDESSGLGWVIVGAVLVVLALLGGCLWWRRRSG